MSILSGGAIDCTNVSQEENPPKPKASENVNKQLIRVSCCFILHGEQILSSIIQGQYTNQTYYTQNTPMSGTTSAEQLMRRGK